MNHFPTLLLTLASLMATQLANAAPTMAEAWQQLSQQSALVKSLDASIDANTAAVREAQYRRLPEFGVSGQWNHLNDEIGLTLDLSSINPALPATYYKIQDQQYITTQLTAKLPLYAGGAINAGIDAAEANLLLSQAQAEQTETDLFTRFVERYLTVELAKQKATIQKQALDNLEQHLNRANRMYEEGTLSLTEKLQTQVERDKADRNWRQATQDVVLAEAAYQGLYLQPAVMPSGKLSFQPAELPEEQQINTLVLSNSPALTQIQAGTQLVEAGKKANNASYLPKVAAFAQYELNKDSLTVLQPEWVAGVAFEWTFGSAGWYAKQQSLVSQGEALVWNQKQVKNDLALLIRKHLTAFNQAESDYDALQSSLALANENLRLQSKAFEQGLKTSLDKIDAQLLVTGLELESQKALFDYYVASAHLHALMQDNDHFLQLMQQVHNH